MENFEALFGTSDVDVAAYLQSSGYADVAALVVLNGHMQCRPNWKPAIQIQMQPNPPHTVDFLTQQEAAFTNRQVHIEPTAFLQVRRSLWVRIHNTRGEAITRARAQLAKSTDTVTVG